MKYPKAIIILLISLLIIGFVPFAKAQSSQSYITYHVELTKVKSTTYTHNYLNLSYNETLSSKEINATLYNNTVSLKGVFSFQSSVFNISYSKPFSINYSYESKHSLVNEILALNLTKVINFTVDIFKKINIDGLVYVKNITYEPNGTVNVNFQGNTYSLNSYVLKGNITFALSHKNSVIELTKLNFGKVLLFKNGLLYSAYFVKNSSSSIDISTKYFKINYTSQFQEKFLIQLLSTNLALPHDAPYLSQLAIYVSIAAGIVFIAGMFSKSFKNYIFRKSS